MKNLTRFRFVILIVVTGFLFHFNCLSQETNWLVMAWWDEFNYTGTPDTSKWGYDVGAGGWGNNEEQYYTNERSNSYVENGELHIEALKENDSWTSARLVTKNKGDWLNGRVEVKANIPSGRGTWPAIWMLPTDWEYGEWPSSGEIDIMEHVGYEPTTIYGTVHTEAYNHGLGTQRGDNIQVPDAEQEFYLYAIEWDQGRISFFVDDSCYYTFWNPQISYKEWPFDKRFHLLLNIAIGGSWGGAQGIDPMLTQASMEIDYVRVYSRDTIPPEISGPGFTRTGDTVKYNTYIYKDGEYQWAFPETTEILSGQGTNEITVVWGDSAGYVGVDVSIPGKTFETSNLLVGVIIIPSGDAFNIDPADENDSLLWVVENETGNLLQPALSAGMLEIGYNITDLYENSCLVYRFEHPVVFSEYRVMEFYIKSGGANPPGNMRIDMVDINGNVNPNELFEIVTFEEDDQFHEFHKVFGIYPDENYRLDRVAEICIYINWGDAGVAGSGTVWIDSLRMVPYTGQINTIPVVDEECFSIFPNPVEEILNLNFERSISASRNTKIVLYSVKGVPLFDFVLEKGIDKYSIQTNTLTPGIYILKINSGNQLFSRVFVKQQ